MRFDDFLKDKFWEFVLLVFIIITIEIFLMIYPFALFLKIYIPIILLVFYFIAILMEYLKKKHFYMEIKGFLKELDEAYLVTELIKTPNFIEGKIFKEIIEEINKSMIENVNNYKFLQQDYEDFIELWIHEIKIPISASKMVIENNKNSVTESIDEELEKIENYTEQALFYARSNTVNQDYFIKKNKLLDMVNECIKRNKKVLIQEKIFVNLHDLDFEVNTDNKWIVFILNQVIQNSIKYRKKQENSEIEIYGKQNKENVILYIKDNGMGIREGEIRRVFEKGFTGTNGRKLNKKSTGIGLYLCKKLCDKLGIAIQLNSSEGEWTEIHLILPNNSYIDMKN